MRDTCFFDFFCMALYKTVDCNRYRCSLFYFLETQVPTLHHCVPTILVFITVYILFILRSLHFWYVCSLSKLPNSAAVMVCVSFAGFDIFL